MGLFTPDIDSLRELYLTMLKRALNSERQIVEKGLPAMIEKSTNPQLAHAFQQHLEESKTHISRVERILAQQDGKVDDAKCKVTAALISEAESSMGDIGSAGVRDVMLIAAGNQVEHHEIAVYGTLRTWALVLGDDEAAVLLEKTLEEEIQADKTLGKLSEQINVAAPV